MFDMESVLSVEENVWSGHTSVVFAEFWDMNVDRQIIPILILVTKSLTRNCGINISNMEVGNSVQ